MRYAPLFILPLLASAPLLAAEPVALPEFKSVELRGGGHVTIRPGPARVTIVEGSTRFTRFHVDKDGQLKIDACAGPCPRHYILKIELSYPTVLPMGVKGGGTITAASGFGTQQTVAVGIGGGGLIDLRSVTAETVAAGVHGGGKIMVGPSRSLAAAATGGGEIRYAGDPKVTSVINGGGSIRPGS
jgi:hypothetical protein